MRFPKDPSHPFFFSQLLLFLNSNLTALNTLMMFFLPILISDLVSFLISSLIYGLISGLVSFLITGLITSLVSF